MVVSSLDSYEVIFLSLAPYGESPFISTLSCVSFQTAKKPAQDRPVFSGPGDIRRGTKLSAARSNGHTPRKLPHFMSNLPHHRRLRPFRRPVIIQHPSVCVKGFLKKILADFPGFSPCRLSILRCSAAYGNGPRLLAGARCLCVL